MVDEWNLSAGGFDTRMDTYEGAAFQTATLAALASDGLDRALLYSAIDPNDRDINGKPLPARHGGWGVIDRTGARKPAWYAQWLWSRLDGGHRLASPQDPVGGVWTAAATNTGRVDVLASSFLGAGARDRALHLAMAGLAPGPWTVRLFRVDKTHAGATDPDETFGVVAGADGSTALDTALPAQSVVLVELTPAPAR
jgi:beta-xylosidase